MNSMILKFPIVCDKYSISNFSVCLRNGMLFVMYAVRYSSFSIKTALVRCLWYICLIPFPPIRLFTIDYCGIGTSNSILFWLFDWSLWHIRRRFTIDAKYAQIKHFVNNIFVLCLWNGKYLFFTSCYWIRSWFFSISKLRKLLVFFFVKTFLNCVHCTRNIKPFYLD